MNNKEKFKVVIFRQYGKNGSIQSYHKTKDECEKVINELKPKYIWGTRFEVYETINRNEKSVFVTYKQ